MQGQSIHPISSSLCGNKNQICAILLRAHKQATRKLPQESKIFGLAHTQDVHEYNHIVEAANYTIPATTRRPDCTGSTTPMPCIQMRRLATRLLVGRSHWLSPCVRSLRLAVRLLVVRLAPALLRLCRASGRAVSTLDFSSVGRTGSRRVPCHSIVRRDYPSRGRNGYTSPTPRVRVPRHVARLITRLVAQARR
jgi:hypothetical protein